MYLKFVFLINCIWLRKAYCTLDDVTTLANLLKPFDHLTSLPKKYALTDDELSDVKQAYLSGLHNEDIYLNGTELIEKYGYKYEEHHTITSDGYNLTMIRIPGNGPKIFVMHGLLASFVDWLTIGPDKCLPFLLADAGYDVWMGNARCNTFSKQNIYLSTSDLEYCEVSWDKIGRIDLPAMIDYILDLTGETSLTYIGHSQGTTAFFVMCSEKLEYNDKINFMIALSAVAWMKHAISPLVRIASPASNIPLIDRALGVTTPPDNAIKKALSIALCGNAFFASIICANIEFLLCGFDYPQIDFKQLPVIYTHTPAEASLRQLQHYGQLVVSGDFRRFDYGPLLNPVKYGSLTPPSYPVENITVRMAIFYSSGDWLANPIDVNVLRQKLPNVVEYHKVALETFNHNDFLWAKDVKTLVYDRVLELIKENI